MALDLITIDEIAALFRVHVGTVRNRWVHAHDFPAPVLAPSPRRRQWSRAAVIAWAKPAEQRSARASRGSRSSAVATSPDAR